MIWLVKSKNLILRVSHYLFLTNTALMVNRRGIEHAAENPERESWRGMEDHSHKLVDRRAKKVQTRMYWQCSIIYLCMNNRTYLRTRLYTDVATRDNENRSA